LSSTLGSRRSFRGLILGAAVALLVPAAAQATDFNTPGAYQEYTVPDGVHTLTIDLNGAGGGTNGGRGARVQSLIHVTPGEVLRVYVGGEGGAGAGKGWNGGGRGFGSQQTAGGGATDIRRAPYGLDDRLVVAGGGGGAGSAPHLGGSPS
jgi:hypothetical protein